MSWKLGMGCCCATSGPWDWYADFHETGGGGLDEAPSLPGTEFFGRVPGIYDFLGDNTFTPADCSLDANDSAYEWTIELLSSDSGGEGANWLTKSLQSTIAPLGNSTEEFFFAHITQGGDEAWVRVDCDNQVVDWIVPDTAAEWSPDTPIGSITIALSSNAMGSVDYPNVPQFIPEFTGSWVSSTAGLEKVVTQADVTFYPRVAHYLEHWKISSGGSISYGEYDQVAIHTGAAGTAETFPMYSCLVTSDAQIWDGYTKMPFLTTGGGHMPIMHARQSNRMAGIAYPHIIGFPNLPVFPLTEDYTPSVTINIGTLTIDPLTGLYYVDGSAVFSEEGSTFQFGEGEVSMEYIFAAVEWFDASDDTSIMVVNWHYRVETAPSIYDEYLMTCIIPSETRDDPITIYHHDGSDYVTGYDNRAYYPRWYGVRSLHNSEEGGRRNIAFERVPFDQDEADADFGGSSQLMSVRLRCYEGGSTDYTMLARHDNGTPKASGTINMTTTTVDTTFLLTAAAGGDADREAWGNGSISIVLVDGPETNCTYDNSSHILTVTLDFSGGTKTIADLRAAIGLSSSAPGGGDWYATNDGGTNDALIIDDDDTGSDDAPFTGATDGITLGASPAVVDSSDRFYYVVGFPYRLDSEYPRKIHHKWMISHDGTILNPMGEGVRTDRGEPNPTFMMPMSFNYSCVKNSERIDFCPAKEEI